jgi:hypothetical protein
MNGWHRIGITASVLWFIAGGIWGCNVGLHEADLDRDRTRFDCLYPTHPDTGRVSSNGQKPQDNTKWRIVGFDGVVTEYDEQGNPVTWEVQNNPTMKDASFHAVVIKWDSLGNPITWKTKENPKTVFHGVVTAWDAQGNLLSLKTQPVYLDPKTGEPIVIDPATGERVDNKQKLDEAACSQRAEERSPIRDYWPYPALYALTPIALGWPTAYGIIALLRWIRAGFVTSR